MVKTVLKYRGPFAFLLIFILVTGVFTYLRLNISLFPNITFPKIKIIAENGNQPVDKMMITVTIPLENAIKRIENLQMLRSTTSMGSCEISAFIDWGADVDLAKQQIESQIASIKNSLPSGLQVTVEKMNPSILPVMGYSLHSDSKNPVELRMIGEYTVKPFLSKVQGVSSVDVIGGRTKEYKVILNEEKLKMLGIYPQDIINAIEATGFIESAGLVADYRRLYLTLTDATIKNIQRIGDIVIKNDSIRKITIGDIADIKAGEHTEFIKIKANGKDVPIIAIRKQPNVNLIQVADSVAAKVTELNKILPPGVYLKPYYNQAIFVKDSIRSIIDVLWVGLLLAIIVVMFFLRSFRQGFVLLLTIPLTLSLSFIVMKFFGFDLNIMTIGAIAASIGLIIDDAVIVIEHIQRTMEENPGERSLGLLSGAIQFLFPAMLSSSLSTILIFLPFVLMTGVAGAYFKVLTDTMIITLVSSFFATWVGLPLIYSLFNKKIGLGKNSPEFKNLQWINYLISRPYVVLGLVAFALFTFVYVLPRLQSGFLPEMDEGSIVLDYNSPPGTSLEETDRMLSEVDKILDQIPEVKAYSRRTGTQMGFFITEPNRGDYLIELSKKRKRTTVEVIDEIRTKVESTVPALTVDFGQVITDMLGDLMTSVQPIELKIFGAEDDKLKELSKLCAAKVREVPGTADVFNGIVIAGPVIKIHPRQDVLRRFGMTDQDLHDQVKLYLEGTVAGAIQEKEQLTDIRVMYAKNYKTPVNEIKEMPVFNRNSFYRPLSSFADLEIVPGVSEINRENLQTMGVVTARLNNRDLGSVMRDIKAKISSLNLPPSIQVEYGGSYANQQQSFRELLTILVIGAILVFIIVLFMSGSIGISLAVLLASILATSGSIMALYLTHTPLNVGSYTGLIMILGIIGENSIFTIHRFQHFLREYPPAHAMTMAVQIRIRPIFMTVLSAIVALSFLALGIGTGAQMHQPLAIAVIGGFVVGLPLLLFVVPTLVLYIHRFSRHQTSGF